MAGGEIEWIEPDPHSAPADVIQAGGPRRPVWRWWYALVAIAAVAALLVATRPGHGQPKASASPTPSPSAPVHSSDPAGLAAPSSAAATSTAVVTSTGPSLLDVPADWQLFGRASSAVVKIELAAGRVTVTPIPLLSSGGPASFVVGPGRVIVRPLDAVAGYFVDDGQPFQTLPDGFAATGPALPGPDSSHLWVPSPDGNSMQLVDFDDVATGTTVAVPPHVDISDLQSDGAGYLDFSDVGGVYDLRPSGIQRITTGELLAAGPTKWLTEECDLHDSCRATVIDRATGAQHALSVSVNQLASGGLISPDGTTVAVLEGDQSQPVDVHLIDLTTGADRATGAAIDPNLAYQDGLFVWSPDSHWLFTTNATGRLYAVNVPADTTTTLTTALTLGPVSQLGLRTSSG